MMILESGDELWKLVGTPAVRGAAGPRPSARRCSATSSSSSRTRRSRRVVFIATPHRGSELGDQFIGRLADRLIRLPSSLRPTYRALLAQNGPDFFTPEIRDGPAVEHRRAPARQPAPDDARPPAGRARGSRSTRSSARRTPTVPIEQGSDGVVPYASSHLDWATSELVVPGDHGCQDGPETIRELRRILPPPRPARDSPKPPPPARPGGGPTPGPRCLAVGGRAGGRARRIRSITAGDGTRPGGSPDRRGRDARAGCDLARSGSSCSTPTSAMSGSLPGS